MAEITNDLGNAEIDELMEELAAKLRDEYRRATEDMQKKLDKFLGTFAALDLLMQGKLKRDEITKEEYKNWRYNSILGADNWAYTRDTLAREAMLADKKAMSIVRGYMPEAYALGENYGTYLVENSVMLDTSFELYDRATVERLWRDNPKLLPDPTPGSETARKLKEHKDLIWNRTHIQSEVTQGIIQGESLTKIAERMQNVTTMDYNAAMRNAATMMTSAHNGGRLDGFQRAEDMGIRLKKLWIATLDGRTRYSHRHVDGEAKELSAKFSNGCMFPGDPNGRPEEIYNCRCTMGVQIEEYEIDTTDLSLRSNSALGAMSYDEWKRAR